MKKNKNSLFLFTHEYPFGTGESFIENELAQHISKFDKIYIFPLTQKGELRKIDNKIEILYLYENKQYQPWLLLSKNILGFIKIIVTEFLYCENKISFVKQFSKLKSILLQNYYRSEILATHILKEKEPSSNLYYSFWTDDWATVLGILKQKKIIAGFISRVHGYDLYKERWPDLIIPFRYFQIKNVSKIFSVSKDGLKYLQENFPKFINKFFLSHLTISDYGIEPYKDTNVFTIVSCSNLIPLKRVDLIAESITELDMNVRWVHFGDGVEKSKILAIVKKMPGNISVEMKGMVANQEIIKFYQSNVVNLFIHLSETEGGVPIALQEAASFGIPLLGCNTGGVVEIVNESTGILVDREIELEKLIRTIKLFHESKYNSLDFRVGVRKFWLNNFETKSNYEMFYKQINY